METEISVLTFSSFDENWFTLNDFSFTVEGDLSFSLNFDYETMIRTRKSFLYLYIELDNEKLQIQTRTSFEYTTIDGLSDHIFSVEELVPCIRLALEKSVFKMNRASKYYGYKKGFTMDTSVMDYEFLAQNMVGTYLQYRKPNELSIQKEINTMCLQCSSNDINKIIFMGTFMILDQAFYFNPYFKHEENREIFSECLPYTKYLTIKFKCNSIAKRKLYLSAYDAIQFFLCLDCATQILLGDRADDMKRILEINEFSSLHQTIFINGATQLFATLKESLKMSGAHFPDLEVDHNWIDRIR